MGVHEVVLPDYWSHLIEIFERCVLQGPNTLSDFGHIGGEGDGAGHGIWDEDPEVCEMESRIC